MLYFNTNNFFNHACVVICGYVVMCVCCTWVPGVYNVYNLSLVYHMVL